MDRLVEQVSATLGLRRSMLGITATSKGLFAGDLLITFEATRQPQGRETLQGYPRHQTLIPDADEIKHVRSDDAEWILVVEKEAIFRSLCEEGLASGEVAGAGKGILITVSG